ncbi:hypothetical protein PV721_13960 [Streptomyces sp. MB09-01]|uniref:hypothetical protein n=1 Tax=Streptomyces sp. MB09-01 TaxID=3028666 RepID=UPI0029B65AF8|nr:hypothetical protein [Streptomyces sp. MB09-01]MDX3535456.1 hypothetical protein [Streptomyces sp. MB09-01]
MNLSFNDAERAAQTTAMAYCLVMTISDAVRRAAQKRLTGKEEELGEDAEKMAPGWSADKLRGHLGDDILAVLMQGAAWPQLARRVDLGVFLPQMGRMTAAVRQAVTANTARITTLRDGLVRDAILASPAWPDIAAGHGDSTWPVRHALRWLTLPPDDVPGGARTWQRA